MSADFPDASRTQPIAPFSSTSPEVSGPPAVRLKAILKQTLGVSYVADGTSPESGGFSPGGLVQWVFRRMGIVNVPRIIEDQMVMAGTVLDPKGYKPAIGDILFFDIGGMKHVGLYYDVRRNTFISVVPGKGGVVIADFNDPFFRSRFIFARRIPLN